MQENALWAISLSVSKFQFSTLYHQSSTNATATITIIRTVSLGFSSAFKGGGFWPRAAARARSFAALEAASAAWSAASSK